MNVPTFTISELTQHGEQQLTEICVIDKQPFYKSSGTQSSLSGVWLPFKEFGASIPGYTGMIHKPDVAYDVSRTRIGSLFPPRIVKILTNPGIIENNKWGRFKDMKCLYISYLLSGSNMPEILRNEIYYYVTETHRDLNLQPIVSDSECMDLTEENIIALNKKLQDFGADLYESQLQPFGQLPIGEELVEDAAAITNPIYTESRNLEENAFDSLEATNDLDYPEVLQKGTDLMNFIDNAPSMHTQMMRLCCCCLRTSSVSSEQVNNQKLFVDNNSSAVRR